MLLTGFCDVKYTGQTRSWEAIRSCTITACHIGRMHAIEGVIIIFQWDSYSWNEAWFPERNERHPWTDLASRAILLIHISLFKAIKNLVQASIQTTYHGSYSCSGAAMWRLGHSGHSLTNRVWKCMPNPKPYRAAASWIGRIVKSSTSKRTWTKTMTRLDPILRGLKEKLIFRQLKCLV